MRTYGLNPLNFVSMESFHTNNFDCLCTYYIFQTFKSILRADKCKELIKDDRLSRKGNFL